MIIPILKIGSNLIASIQIELTDEQARQFQIDLLEEVAAAEATGLLIDITVVDVIDTFMARILNDIAHSVRIMGTHVVITGMLPEVAVTLVMMGRRMVDVETARDLEQGLKKLQEMGERKPGERGEN